MECTSYNIAGHGQIVRQPCPKLWRQRSCCRPRMGLAHSRFLRPSAIDRSMTLAAATASQELTRHTAQIVPAGLETDPSGLQRLSFRREGWNFWQWKGNKVHYIAAGTEGPPVVLIHGFGASAYHWRYAVPELAKTHRVYAVDLLGFGWSDKPLVEYSKYQVWPEQLADFVREVVGGGPVVLVGNSLGGYASLATAVEHPDAVRAIALLNAAGRFEDVKRTTEAAAEAALPDSPASGAARAALREAAGVGGSDGAATDTAGSTERRATNGQASVSGEEQEQPQSLLGQLVDGVKSLALRGSVYASFFVAKQPARIRQVLQQVYIDDTNIDEDLVDSIVRPAQDPNAAEVFYRIITGKGTPVNQLLARLDKPLLLLWGAQDPWITPRSADRIVSLYPSSRKVLIRGGHCPHDDAPQETNAQLLKWLAALD